MELASFVWLNYAKFLKVGWKGKYKRKERKKSVQKKGKIRRQRIEMNQISLTLISGLSFGDAFLQRFVCVYSSCHISAQKYERWVDAGMHAFFYAVKLLNRSRAH